MPIERTLVVPDVHVPEHDPEAIETLLAVVASWRPDRIVILGDFLDCGAWSSHARQSPEEGAASFLADEVGPANLLLDRLAGRAQRPIVYLEGNHEHRVARWLANHAAHLGPDLLTLASPAHLLRHRVGADGRPRGERSRFTWIPYVGAGVHSHYKIAPNLIAIHGWSCAKNAARTHLEAARSCSIVHGHTHRAQAVTGRDPLTGEIYHAWSPGCLAKLHPLYMANNPHDWSHGISLIYHGSQARDWTYYTVPIQRGRAILPDGREIRAG